MNPLFRFTLGFSILWEAQGGCVLTGKDIMARREEYEAKAEAMITPIIEANHFELVDVEYDKEGGITVDDCELVSRAFSDLLDKEDFIEDAYILEVSSPGLLRPLRKDKDFRRNIGNEVELRLYKAVNKVKEDRGILTAFDDSTVTIEHEDGTTAVYERAALALIRLAFDF